MPPWLPRWLLPTRQAKRSRVARPQASGVLSAARESPRIPTREENHRSRQGIELLSVVAFTHGACFLDHDHRSEAAGEPAYASQGCFSPQNNEEEGVSASQPENCTLRRGETT